MEAHLAVPVPDSGVTTALGYCAESGIPFRHALMRNHYVGRTFIEPSQAIRDSGVKLKLNPVRHLLEGRRVVLVDDSILRRFVEADTHHDCNYCYACYTGNYPTELVNIEELMTKRGERHGRRGTPDEHGYRVVEHSRFRRPCSNRPVFERQANDLPEDPIVGHEGRTCSERLRGYQQVKRHKSFVMAFQTGPDSLVTLRGSIDTPRQLPRGGMGTFHVWPLD